MTQMTDEEIDGIYAAATSQSLREQDKPIAHAFARALLAKAVPDGYVVVPKVPTDEMTDAGYGAYRTTVGVDKWVRYVYAAMISAGPSAEGV